MNRFLLSLSASTLVIWICLFACSSQAQTTETLEKLKQTFPKLPAYPYPSQDSSEEVTKIRVWLDAAEKLYLSEKDPKKKAQLEPILYRMAQVDYHTRILSEITIGGTLDSREVKDTATTSLIPVEPIKTILKNVDITYRPFGKAIFRHVGVNRLECWTSTTGYLFTLSGKLLKEVAIPRRDGCGREWYGAFLANGSYCTTDIWVKDKQLHIFTSSGEWIKSLHLPCTVAWARANESGKAWYVRSSTESCGPEYQLVSPDGSSRTVDSNLSNYVDVREVGPARIHFVDRTQPSDDRKLVIQLYTAGHGRGAMFGTYKGFAVQNSSDLKIQEINREPVFSRQLLMFMGRKFGFFPGSHTWWTAGYISEDLPCTWIMDDKGDVVGWTKAQHLGDAADGESQLFMYDDQSVIDVSPKCKVSKKRFFQINDQTVEPLWLDDKDGLGFFRNGSDVVLAKWSH